MKQRGFTVTELLIVIVIMSILLILAVVNVRSTQVQARDNERHADVENISVVLDRFHKNTHNNRWRNTYPGTTNMMTPYITNYLRSNLGQGSQHAPGVDVNGPTSIVIATNNNQTTTGVRPLPTISTYVYQPLTPTNAVCTTYAATTPCIKYNLFYRLEKPTDDCPAPNNTCIARSQSQ